MQRHLRKVESSGKAVEGWLYFVKGVGFGWLYRKNRVGGTKWDEKNAKLCKNVLKPGAVKRRELK